jgi:hypothetical protein
MTAHDLWLQYEVGIWCINISILLINGVLFHTMYTWGRDASSDEEEASWHA